MVGFDKTVFVKAFCFLYILCEGFVKGCGDYVKAFCLVFMNRAIELP